MSRLSITVLTLGTALSTSAWAAGKATKATITTEARSNDGVDQARIKTWLLNGGTKIIAESLERDGVRFGYARTVERIDGSKHTVGKYGGVAYRASSGYLGGAHLSTRHGADGNGYTTAVNANGTTYTRFTGPLFQNQQVMKIRRR